MRSWGKPRQAVEAVRQSIDDAGAAVRGAMAVAVVAAIVAIIALVLGVRAVRR